MQQPKDFFFDSSIEEYLDLYYREEPRKLRMHKGRRRIKYSRKALNKRQRKNHKLHTVASLPTVSAEEDGLNSLFWN